MQSDESYQEHEPDWTIALLRRPASRGSGQPGDATWMFEIICRLCGDDPGVDYRETPVHLRQIRGPYSSTFGAAAFLQHCELHDGGEERRTVTPWLGRAAVGDARLTTGGQPR
jgi:hypothetical protein